MYKMLIPLFAIAFLLIGCTAQQDSLPKEPAMDDKKPTFVGFDGELLTGTHTVHLWTSEGNMTLELDADKAPKTVTNFVVLAQTGYYDDLTFHRVIPGFMIQGGDPSGNGTGGESIFGDTFEDEINDIPMDRGVIAMANRGPDTNGSQFFIITKEDGTPWLEGKHTAFGKVIDGMKIVDKIVNVDRGPNDMPLDPVTFRVEIDK
jgi:peptidyl-prolyl cis-trans isomerase B (cyclophilin B)